MLQQNFADEPDVSIQEALKEASTWAAVNDDLPLDILGCDLDLDAACPLGSVSGDRGCVSACLLAGWADAGDGGSCLALLAAYSRLALFRTASRRHRSTMGGAEIACNSVCWEPCRSCCLFPSSDNTGGLLPIEKLEQAGRLDSVTF